MIVFNGGSVDHYLSWKRYPQRAYDWDNYRFVAGWINSSKRTLDDDVLDPFQVEDDWFEIILPSLQLVLTDAVPPQHRDRAELTLKRLHLRDGEQVIELRQELYQRYQEGKLPLPLLREWAPLIARAVEKQMAQKRQQQQQKKRKPLLERLEEASTWYVPTLRFLVSETPVPEKLEAASKPGKPKSKKRKKKPTRRQGSE
jgi:hypothetical protein